ncbi:hypothetical protein B0T22DRAFT_437110 [Podospora appendiculata]|uniref:Uncharacterized protein n=1 Tax=Podospora appendiculata TaxID=314037 RepID=A0AAE0XID3_9PEZI|nr:hypothetical protein B0T22DRAFT_437110 [Podospora appendiculata]
MLLKVPGHDRTRNGSMIRTTLGCVRRGLVNPARPGPGPGPDAIWPRCYSDSKPQPEFEIDDVRPGSIPSPALLIQTYENPDAVKPGPWILRKAAELNLGFPNHVRIVKGQDNGAAVKALVSSKHCISSFHMKYFTQLTHALTDKYFALYQAKMDKPLWLQLQILTAGTNCKSVVRTTSRKMLKEAFIRALKANGYDPWGRANGEDAVEDLYGTVKLQIVRPKEVAQTKPEDLVAFLTPLISGQIKASLLKGSAFRRPVSGRHSTPKTELDRELQRQGWPYKKEYNKRPSRDRQAWLVKP